MAQVAAILASGRERFGSLNRIELLRVIAERAAARLQTIDSGANVDVQAVYERGIESGIAQIGSKRGLLSVIAQKAFELT